MKGAGDRNRPKRRILRHLGHRYVFFFFPLYILILKQYFTYICYYLRNTNGEGDGSQIAWVDTLTNFRAKSRARFDFSKVACDFGVLFLFLFIQ